MNNTNITYNNSIAITTYTINIANDTDITYFICEIIISASIIPQIFYFIPLISRAHCP